MAPGKKATTAAVKREQRKPPLKRAREKKRLVPSMDQGPIVDDDDNCDDLLAQERIKPIQPALFCEDLAPLINRLYPQPSSRWADEDIEELGSLMANRGGFNSMHNQAIASAGIAGKLEWFFGQYVSLYETNSRFCEMIDPWYVICEGWPDNVEFTKALNDANAHIRGNGLAGGENEPIQFNNGRNWFLHCLNREDAAKVSAFLHGRVNSAAFHTTIVDSRYLNYK